MEQRCWRRHRSCSAGVSHRRTPTTPSAWTISSRRRWRRIRRLRMRPPGRTYRVVRGNNQPDEILEFDWRTIFTVTVRLNDKAGDSDLDLAFPVDITAATVKVKQATGGILSPPTGGDAEHQDYVIAQTSGNRYQRRQHRQQHHVRHLVRPAELAEGSAHRRDDRAEGRRWANVHQELRHPCRALKLQNSLRRNRTNRRPRDAPRDASAARGSKTSSTQSTDWLKVRNVHRLPRAASREKRASGDLAVRSTASDSHERPPRPRRDLVRPREARLEQPRRHLRDRVAPAL